MKLYIKYMVSLRCKMLVKEELKKLGLDCISVELGMAEMQEDITDELREAFRINLEKAGLELLDSKKDILVEKIKNVIIEMVHHAEDIPDVNDSDYISEKLGYDYTYLSNTFSEVKGMTIQKFIILHKIEKAKEMLLYDEDNLTEIAFKLNYSSVAHLSNQFKKVTGFTPSFFKEMKFKREKNLENL
ncbi:helix-turn-helix domain-containing protein [Natronogracilivirga saccharolytica]|uniref:Helix-turn-helix transcriptional regulator n=1 Tax=Natronogracilivirga saccharolytica TaxID=2812953 RepID=A0A8J7UXD5_9BACT|nr:AraC family transcriptional regulator [Natronogracilivirga saccharolytica]MBP3193209.1 helix-turn-helix transcriptional regulator [Natronogracilivirga saccharolytica]